jgi:two-component system phosphate regulon sensor histidine kinase PhoR
MPFGHAGRSSLGALIAVAGLLLALSIGAPFVPALVAFVAGSAAAILFRTSAPNGEAAEIHDITTGLPPLPAAVELAEAVDEPLLLVRNRKIILANSAARAVLGPQIEGIDIRLAIRHPAVAERLGGDAQESEAEGTMRTELVGLGELERRWEMATSRLRDGTWLVRLSDKSAAHAAEQMRVDFVANASHELRTPLATLLGFLETLQDDDAAADPKTRGRFVRIMFDEAKRMQLLVEDLISLSRIEAERFSIPRDSVDLLSLAEDVRTSCQQLLDEQESNIVISADGAPRHVLGDRSQLLQLLRNLVVNALKYGRRGRDVTIEFADSGPDMLRMSVIDHGEGIAPEHLPRITERFYRVDPGRSRAMGGTGLGLAIVKHIVGRHRGRLDIRSRLGEGTSVHVFLPKPTEPSGLMSSKSHTSVTEGAPNGHRATAQADNETGRRLN